MVRQVPRLLFLPLLVSLVGTLSLAAVGTVMMERLSSVIDPTRLHFSLPQGPSPTDTVWLCKPGLVDNPCEGDLSATQVDAEGAVRVQPAGPGKNLPIDCFYVYPTVSLQDAANADLTIDPEERAVARAEVARFSQVCNVYAPMYPQLTKRAISDPEHLSMTAALTAYEGVWHGFLDYLHHYNEGRGIVFIGHSQGAFLLSLLLQSQVNDDPRLRHQLVSAILPGGNVTVETGKPTGGDFTKIPACSSATQIGCVIAYSTYSSPPGEDALFGRVDSPINPFHPDGARDLQVLCVNPAAIGGGTGEALPYMPTFDMTAFVDSSWPASAQAATPYFFYPNEYRATCESNGQASWLQIDRTTSGTDVRPGISQLSKPRWGLHTVDLPIVLGNLLELVRAESDAYAHPSVGGNP